MANQMQLRGFSLQTVVQLIFEPHGQILFLVVAFIFPSTLIFVLKTNGLPRWKSTGTRQEKRAKIRIAGTITGLSSDDVTCRQYNILFKRRIHACKIAGQIYPKFRP